MASPHEHHRTQPVSVRRIAVVLAACLLIVMLFMSQRAHLNEYRLYFTEDRRATMIGFIELDEEWTEQFLNERFSGYPIHCEPYPGPLSADRACAVDIKSFNGVPALFISFFFASGSLNYAAINVPWWAHETAYSQLVATLGEPAALQTELQHGVRLHGWRLNGGAALFFNSDLPLNPIQWNTILWTSNSICRSQGCIPYDES